MGGKNNLGAEKQNIPKHYDPKNVESRWYEFWLKEGSFHAEVNPEKTPYTIVIPPPNVTAALHMGHAYNNTIQDIYIRYRRKQGFEALWLPGTDHAGIATQNVVEKELQKEGKSRFDLGREKFVERVWEWKEQYGNQIIYQLKKMGCSCDWRRERFTMDEGLSKAVLEVFIQLFNKGLIYRGNYIINWCPRCGTAISDEEVEYHEAKGRLWHIKYPVKDSDEFMIVATTRPETMLGDTAIAVHPDDDRYGKQIGKTVILPLLNREIPVIADRHVDPEFGTGAVKVTPAHDPNDFLIGQRHNLQQINILNDDATLNKNVGQYAGLDRFEGRKKVVKDLEKQGLLLKIEEHNHSIGHCHRCDTIIEPLLSTQWFVKMKELAEPAIDVVKSGQLKFHPEERWLKTYLNWMENIRDWCISRQLWWGHRIPVYYCQNCDHMVAAHQEPESCDSCGSENWKQDEDVLDTWFSSWLWPFSTMGWPDETPELKYFYPTDTLITAPDIIFFWVARMIMAGLEFKDEIPFKDVYLNGIVRDEIGRKMSKSLGNGIDPVDIIDRFSADAMRFTLIMLSSEGQDINLSESHFEMGRNFSNKVWNAFRFLAMNLDTPGDNFADYQDSFQLADKWILSRLQKAVKSVSDNLDTFRVNDALSAVYHFFWHEFCDWYLELIKPRLSNDNDSKQKNTAQTVAVHVMKTCMQLLHPFVPFISEDIWHRLKNEDDLAVVSSQWPDEQAEFLNRDLEVQMEFMQNIISSVRNIRSEMNVPQSTKAQVKFKTDDSEKIELIKDQKHYIQQMARVDEIVRIPHDEKVSAAALAVVENVEIFIPLAGLIDLDVERSRLEKEISRLQNQITGLNKKLDNKQFLNKAPKNVIAQQKEKRNNYLEKVNKLKENLELISQEN